MSGRQFVITPSFTFGAIGKLLKHGPRRIVFGDAGDVRALDRRRRVRRQLDRLLETVERKVAKL